MPEKHPSLPLDDASMNLVMLTGLEPASTGREPVILAARRQHRTFGARHEDRTRLNSLDRGVPHQSAWRAWCPWGDLNPRPFPSEGNALNPLSYKDENGGLGGSRTHDLTFRRRPLCPTELRDQNCLTECSEIPITLYRHTLSSETFWQAMMGSNHRHLPPEGSVLPLN